MRILSFILTLLLVFGMQFPRIVSENGLQKVNVFSAVYAGQMANPLKIKQNSSPENEKVLFFSMIKNCLKKAFPFRPKGDDKNKAALFAFFLGIWGAHKFYLGDKKGGYEMLRNTLMAYGVLIAGCILLVAAADMAAAAGTIGFSPLEIFAIILTLGGFIWYATRHVRASIDFVTLLGEVYKKS